MDKNKDHLLRSIDGLKQATAPDVWTHIEMDLDTEAEQNKKALSSSIGQLSGHEAPDVWPAMLEKLEPASSGMGLWRKLAVAAALIVVGSVSHLLMTSASQETVAYSTETVDAFEVGYEFPEWEKQSDDMILNYIKENCTRLAVTCQDPEFKALLEAYLELNETKEELSRSLEQQRAQQPQLMKYLIRVEKNQNEVGKTMLKKLKEI